MRLESGFPDFLASWRTAAQPKQRHQFHLETLADRVYPGHGGWRETGRGGVEVTELGAEGHRVLRLVRSKG